ncbi:MAG: protoporphyrinogen oxidase HemJ [Azospirillaceae bacterium]|nr:protoporphyrinogen oxidase HemJ [Azospirillaceae bacterium]
MDLYSWVKAAHVIAVISWMAGLLYLPRLFVYHCGVAPTSEASATFKVMERKLLRFIMNPAMVVTYAAAIWMLWLTPGWLTDGWLHVKILMVLALTWVHHLMGRWRKDFALDRNQRSARFYRIANEVPTLLMIVIVIMVIVKPF